MQSNKTHRVLHAILRAAWAVAPLLFWLTLLLGFDRTYIAVLTFLSALWHEAAHLGALTLMNKSTRLTGAENGFRIGGFGALGYREEIFAAASGPFANLLISALLIPFCKGGYVSELSLINLLTAICNLMPIAGYDGERILRAIISIRHGPDVADAVCRRASLALTVTLAFFSLYLMLRADSGYWIFFVFIVLLIRFMKDEMTTI